MARKRHHKRQKTSAPHASDAVDVSTTSSSFDANLLCDLLLVHCELGNELLGFLDPHTIAKQLSPVLRFNKQSCSVLSDKQRWRLLLKLHCGIRSIAESSSASTSDDTTASSSEPPSYDQVRESPDGGGKLMICVKRTVAAFGCPALSEYVSLRSQLLHLRQNSFVVEGDLGTITTVGDEQHVVDCLVFSTSHVYHNSGVGVAGRVHERAGPQLDESIERQRINQHHVQCGQVLCTSGFQTGMNLLVHCIGPSGTTPARDTLLYQTYRNALLAVNDNTAVTCAAVASISTGRLRLPVESAATIALRALHDVCFDRDFEAKVAFVCFEKSVLIAFERARTELLRALDEASFVTTQ